MSFSAPGYVFWDGTKYVINGEIEIVGPPGPPGPPGPGGIGNNPVAPTTPVNHATLVWDTNIFDIRPLTQDDIQPGFSITSFAHTGANVAEFGTVFNTPSFTASYSFLPASVSMNDDRYHIVTNLLTPFTAVTLINNYPLSYLSNQNVTFTLTAISLGAVTKTATITISGQARSFGGLGTAGATSATASGATAILNAGHGTLSNEGLHSSDVGLSYGPFSPSGQKIYLLLPHTGSPHVFHDQNGFLFVMNAPIPFTFFNQLGNGVTMDLYESTNLLSTSFTITVVS